MTEMGKGEPMSQARMSRKHSTIARRGDVLVIQDDGNLSHDFAGSKIALYS